MRRTTVQTKLLPPISMYCEVVMRYMCIFSALAFLFFSAVVHAAEEGDKQEQQGPPPARVVVEKSVSGTVRPQTEIVGTVYYPDVSQTASEISGRVDKTSFEEGFTVESGAVLARLDTQLLRKELEAAKAGHQEALTDLEDARLKFKRLASLRESESVAVSEYDKARFAVESAEKRAVSEKAAMEKLSIQIAKAVIRAPFAGIVVEEHAQPGEWLSPGSPVATIARNDEMDIVVDAPQSILPFAIPGAPALVRIHGQEIEGKVHAVVPKGDVATRTFPVKIRIPNNGGLIQGMEASVRLPAGEKQEAVLVPRDAVIQPRGSFVIYVAVKGVAQMIPVQVQSYVGMQAAVQGPGLQPGMDVVVKGNERLRPGQPVTIVTQ